MMADASRSAGLAGLGRTSPARSRRALLRAAARPRRGRSTVRDGRSGGMILGLATRGTTFAGRLGATTPGARMSEAAAAGLIALGLRMSDAAAAGFMELGLRMSDAAALGLIAML
jgi:hypothetical protein